VHACESEDLPAVPGAPRLAAHRLEEWASGRNGCSWLCALRRIGFASVGGDHPVD
jgi:5-methyltetrahydropteroyltriglutamate--homocysteine methyltransferase